MRKLLKKSAKAPRVMITDKLKSYGAARNVVATICSRRLWTSSLQANRLPSISMTVR
jgi:transposase-like protein